MQPFQQAWMKRSTGEVCGLYFTVPGSWQTTRHYLPQVKLESHTTITSVCYTTTLSQTFNNPSQDAVSQARYTFPLYDGVAVSAYTITYGDNILKGIVQQKEKAKKTYDAAVERGETAGLLESLPAGVFGVTLGNLPAKTDVHVDIVYCGELKHDAAIDGLRYMLPTSIAPRYGEYPGQLLESTAINKGGISITVDVDMNKNAIRKVQSPSHPIAVSLRATSSLNSQAEFNQTKASTTLTLGTAELEGDFVLQLQIDDLCKPQAILEQHPDLPSRAIMATFVPRFALETCHPEIVFIADQSGSMRGDNNTALVSALEIFFKSLPLGVHFNIIAFGSNFKALWHKSQVYNESNMAAAIAFVDTFEAQYGGTEMLQPIEAAFEQRLGDMPLEVMLLTDGEIWQEEELFSLITKQVGKKDMGTRVFTLGVGSRVSHTLVEGVARAGNGFAQFVTQGEETDRKVVRMLKGALYPHLKDQTLEINYGKDADQTDTASDDDFELVEKVDYGINIENPSSPKPAEQIIADVTQNDESKDKVISLYDTSADLDSPIKAGSVDSLPAITTPKIIQAPNELASLFPFNRTTVYLLLSGDAPQKKISSITFRATAPQGPLELTIDVDDTKTSETTIHQLAAKKVIQDLEEGRGWLQTAAIDGVLLKDSHKTRFKEFVKREAVRIGELYQIAGKWTSFVAVDDKNKKANNTTEGTAKVTSRIDPPATKHKRADSRCLSQPLMKVKMCRQPPDMSMSSPRMVVQPRFRSRAIMQAGGSGALSSTGSAASQADLAISRGGFPQPTKCNFKGRSAAEGKAMYETSLMLEESDDEEEESEDEQGSEDEGKAEDEDESEDGCGAMDSVSFDDDDQLAAAPSAAQAGGSGALFSTGSAASQEAFESSFVLRKKKKCMKGGSLAAIEEMYAISLTLTDNEWVSSEDEDEAEEDCGAMDSVSFDAADQSATASVAAAPMPTTHLSPASERSVLHQLIGLQTFVGAWDWNDELFKIIGKEVAFDHEAFALKQVLATALAVAFLESKLAASRDVWEMVVAKAKAFIVSQGVQYPERAVEAAKVWL